MGRAPGIVQINQYAQRTSAKGRAMPRAPLIEQPVGDLQNFMGDASAGVGALANMAERKEQVDIAVERIAQARDEDDARAYSAAALADATARYAARAREVESAAPDGWRGLTESSNAAFQEIDAQIIGAAPTETAQRYVAQHLGILRSEALMRTATRETELRRGWRTDTLEASAAQWERTLAVDPSQWARAHATMSQTIGSMTDITADDRRDLSTRTSERLAYFAVAGMVQSNPSDSLARLRGQGGGASAEVLGPQIAAAFATNVTSGRRTPERNAAVGGAENSLHLSGSAIDLAPPAQYEGMSRDAIEADARARLSERFPGVEFSEVIWEGDHLHVGWAGGGEGVAADTEGPFAFLSAEDRLRLANQAEAQMRENRSAISTRRSAAMGMWRLGEQAPEAPTIEEVRAAEGEAQATEYAIAYQAHQFGASMSELPHADLVRLANRRPPTDGPVADRYQAIAQRQAAIALLEQRADPMAYLQRSGRMNTRGFADAVQSSNYATVGAHLHQRVAIAEESRSLFGAPVPLVSRAEAQNLRSALDRLPVQAQQAAIGQMLQSLGSTERAMTAAQIYPDAPGAQLALMLPDRFSGLEGAPNLTREVAQRRLLDGARALGMTQTQNTASEEGSDRPRQTFAMPSDSQLRRAWASEVGNAYQGAPEVEARAFEAFRAAYAGAAIEAGRTDGVFQSRFSREAAAIASGGIMRDGDQRVLLPWGMSEEGFRRSISAGWEDIQASYPNSGLSGQAASRFSFQNTGKPGLYRVVTRQGVSVTDENGRPINIRVGGRR